MKKSLLLLSILLMSVIYSHAQQPGIFLYETDTGYTYVDKNFKPVINKTFKFAGRFFEGLAVASENGYVGYINEEGKIVYKNRRPEDFEKGVKLNINYMEESGLFSCTPDDNTIKQSFAKDKISLALDSTVYEKSVEYWFPPKKLCHRFRIINETQDTLLTQERFVDMISVQAKDKNGIWRSIQTSIPTDVNSSKIDKLEPDKFWEFAIQSYSGGFKTKMRVVVTISTPVVFYRDENKIIANEQREFISNEIDCEINASQFVRSQFTKSSSEEYPFEDYLFDRIRSIP